MAEDNPDDWVEKVQDYIQNPDGDIDIEFEDIDMYNYNCTFPDANDGTILHKLFQDEKAPICYYLTALFEHLQVDKPNACVVQHLDEKGMSAIMHACSDEFATRVKKDVGYHVDIILHAILVDDRVSKKKTSKITLLDIIFLITQTWWREEEEDKDEDGEGVASNPFGPSDPSPFGPTNLSRPWGARGPEYYFTYEDEDEEDEEEEEEEENEEEEEEEKEDGEGVASNPFGTSNSSRPFGAQGPEWDTAGDEEEENEEDADEEEEDAILDFSDAERFGWLHGLLEWAGVPKDTVEVGGELVLSHAWFIHDVISYFAAQDGGFAQAFADASNVSELMIEPFERICKQKMDFYDEDSDIAGDLLNAFTRHHNACTFFPPASLNVMSCTKRWDNVDEYSKSSRFVFTLLAFPTGKPVAFKQIFKKLYKRPGILCDPRKLEGMYPDNSAETSAMQCNKPMRILYALSCVGNKSYGDVIENLNTDTGVNIENFQDEIDDRADMMELFLDNSAGVYDTISYTPEGMPSLIANLIWRSLFYEKWPTSDEDDPKSNKHPFSMRKMIKVVLDEVKTRSAAEQQAFLDTFDIDVYFTLLVRALWEDDEEARETLSWTSLFKIVLQEFSVCSEDTFDPTCTFGSDEYAQEYNTLMLLCCYDETVWLRLPDKTQGFYDPSITDGDIKKVLKAKTFFFERGFEVRNTALVELLFVKFLKSKKAVNRSVDCVEHKMYKDYYPEKASPLSCAADKLLGKRVNQLLANGAKVDPALIGTLVHRAAKETVIERRHGVMSQNTLQSKLVRMGALDRKLKSLKRILDAKPDYTTVATIKREIKRISGYIRAHSIPEDDDDMDTATSSAQTKKKIVTVLASICKYSREELNGMLNKCGEKHKDTEAWKTLYKRYVTVVDEHAMVEFSKTGDLLKLELEIFKKDICADVALHFLDTTFEKNKQDGLFTVLKKPLGDEKPTNDDYYHLTGLDIQYVMQYYHSMGKKGECDEVQFFFTNAILFMPEWRMSRKPEGMGLSFGRVVTKKGHDKGAYDVTSSPVSMFDYIPFTRMDCKLKMQSYLLEQFSDVQAAVPQEPKKTFVKPSLSSYQKNGKRKAAEKGVLTTYIKKVTADGGAAGGAEPVAPARRTLPLSLNVSKFDLFYYRNLEKQMTLEVNESIVKIIKKYAPGQLPVMLDDPRMQTPEHKDETQKAKKRKVIGNPPSSACKIAAAFNDMSLHPAPMTVKTL